LFASSRNPKRLPTPTFVEEFRDFVGAIVIVTVTRRLEKRSPLFAITQVRITTVAHHLRKIALGDDGARETPAFQSPIILDLSVMPSQLSHYPERQQTEDIPRHHPATTSEIGK
jgi:hypothetical protein